MYEVNNFLKLSNINTVHQIVQELIAENAIKESDISIYAKTIKEEQSKPQKKKSYKPKNIKKEIQQKAKKTTTNNQTPPSDITLKDEEPLFPKQKYTINEYLTRCDKLFELNRLPSSQISKIKKCIETLNMNSSSDFIHLKQSTFLIKVYCHFQRFDEAQALLNGYLRLSNIDNNTKQILNKLYTTVDELKNTEKVKKLASTGLSSAAISEELGIPTYIVIKTLNSQLKTPSNPDFDDNSYR